MLFSKICYQSEAQSSCSAVKAIVNHRRRIVWRKVGSPFKIMAGKAAVSGLKKQSIPASIPQVLRS